MEITHPSSPPLVIPLHHLTRADLPLVGGKNASLGEMITQLHDTGIPVPPGFATTSAAYWAYLDANELRAPIAAAMAAWHAGRQSLAETGQKVRQLICQGQWPLAVEAAIRASYDELCTSAGSDLIITDRHHETNTQERARLRVAVRSSATAEDLPEASFAGQQESYLNVRGVEAVLDAGRRCYASLFTDRAISYRQARGFDYCGIALSIGVQVMVRADVRGGGAGVMFTLDTESGFDGVVLLNAAWGLGENVVQGTVNPDEYQVFKRLLQLDQKTETRVLRPIVKKERGSKVLKMVEENENPSTGTTSTRNVPTSKAEQNAFVLSDEEILTLARWACTIEKHYRSPMDIEWARDGSTGQLWIVQARMETVHAQAKKTAQFRIYAVKKPGPTLTTGVSVGDAAVAGRVCLIETADEIHRFVPGSILVTQVTDPDWVPIMKQAVALITDHGGRTSHAAIVSRELGLPAVVGTGNATYILHTGQDVTVSCAGGEVGVISAGCSAITTQLVDLTALPPCRTRVLVNLANPAAAYRWWRLPVDGIGLVRMEFVVANAIRVHPMALVHFEQLSDTPMKQEIAQLTIGYDAAHKPEYFVEKLAQGLAALCAVFYPKPAIIRLSDFKTNEYARLVGGEEFEKHEENPMLGFRGASRYYSPRYEAGFALECRAIQRLRETMGFTNAIVMVPFCRTVAEAQHVLAVMATHGLRRGEKGLQVYMMCEIPSNVILAAHFAAYFDGFSIGSNDLTQLTLGIDRDSDELAPLFDEQDEAVRWMIRHAINLTHQHHQQQPASSHHIPIGLCGQGPSDHPPFVDFLINAGIDSVSVAPDSFLSVKERVVACERALATYHRPYAEINPTSPGRNQSGGDKSMMKSVHDRGG